MIDAVAFYGIWQRICRRFNRTVDRDEAMDYMAYLERAGMDTAQVYAAAEAVWATREFFPRPADFLAPEAAQGWSALREFADKWTKHMSADDARILIAAIPKRAKTAIDALGGLDVMRNAKDMTWLRKEYLAAFEHAVMEESIRPNRPALPATITESLVGHGDGPGRINVDLIKQLAGVTVENLAQPDATT